MRLLLIDNAARAELKRIKDNAEKIPYTEEEYRKLMLGAEDRKIAGENPDLVCEITDGYRVVYSCGWSPHGQHKHISIGVSSDVAGALPSIESVNFILNELGVPNVESDKVIVWIENIDEYKEKAINIVEVEGK